MGKIFLQIAWNLFQKELSEHKIEVCNSVASWEMFKSVPIQFTVHLFTDKKIALKSTILLGNNSTLQLWYASIGFKAEQFLTSAT